MSGEIETLAIKFYDEITDGDGFTHSKDEIQKLIDAGYIVPMPKRGHYSMTGSLIDLINDRRGDPDWNGGGEEKYRPLVSTFDQSVVCWVNPEDSGDVFTVGDIIRADAIENAVRKFLSEIEDGKPPDIESLFEACDEWGLSPCPCPLCGKHSAHVHSFD